MISKHDIDVLREMIVRCRLAGQQVDEIHVSSRRCPADGLRVFGLPVRLADLPINEVWLIGDGHPPVHFDIEEPLA